MSNEQKRICAERLFDELGSIDDRFIHEADTPYKRKSNTLRRFIIIAVAATLSLSLLMGSLAIGGLAILLFGGDTVGKDQHDDIPDNGVNNEEKEEPSTPSSLDERLNALRGGVYLTSPKEDLKLFDGSIKVVWRYSDEDYCRYTVITKHEATILMNKLKSDRGERFDGNASESMAELWICAGDGRVISPYLDLSAGNVGYGELFEYEPEYEPSDNFSDYLCEIIS